MLKAFRYRLYPNASQKELINKHIGSCRFVYNLALETKKMAYTSNRKNLTCFDLHAQLPDLKKECEWLKEVDSQALQQSITDLDKAYTQFFKHGANFPNFKKNRGTQSFRHPHGVRVRIKNGKLYQPKFRNGIKVVIDRPHKGVIRSSTISRTSTGKYFVSVLCDTGDAIPSKKNIKEKTSVGIDLGLKSFIVTSDGLKVNNPKFLKNTLTRIKVLQRRLHNKKKGSNNNKKKAYKKIALLHERATNQRKDFLHKLSTELVKSHDTLAFESLNVKGMVQNHKLAGAISDAGWGMFVNFCKYKAEWSGKNILQIGRFEPSTKMCSDCGATNHALTLADREWHCANCGSDHDRDVNAAINIKNFALRNTAKGIRGAPVEMSAIAESMKQEVNRRKV